MWNANSRVVNASDTAAACVEEVTSVSFVTALFCEGTLQPTVANLVWCEKWTAGRLRPAD